MSHLWLRHLTHSDLKTEAMSFAGKGIPANNLYGPVIGDLIEAKFLLFLVELEYDVPPKGTADIAHLNTDIKSIQIRGKRGGSPKIHGYSRGGPPTYSLLVFLYEYDGQLIVIEDALFVPSTEVSWVQANHYLFSMPEGWFNKYRLANGSDEK